MAEPRARSPAHRQAFPAGRENARAPDRTSCRPRARPLHAALRHSVAAIISGRFGCGTAWPSYLSQLRGPANPRPGKPAVPADIRELDTGLPGRVGGLSRPPASKVYRAPPTRLIYESRARITGRFAVVTDATVFGWGPDSKSATNS